MMSATATATAARSTFMPREATTAIPGGQRRQAGSSGTRGAGPVDSLRLFPAQPRPVLRPPAIQIADEIARLLGGRIGSDAAGSLRHAGDAGHCLKRLQPGETRLAS